MSLPVDREGKLLELILSAKGSTKPTIDSYNFFINYRIPSILDSYHIDVGQNKIAKFINPIFVRPRIKDFEGNEQYRPFYPYEARKNGMSYMAELHATLQMYEIQNGKKVEVPNQRVPVFIGEIPVMLHSDLDWLTQKTPQERLKLYEPEKDQGGYFIIKGSEKVLLNVEKLRDSAPFIYDHKNKQVIRYTSRTLTDSTVVMIFSDKHDIQLTMSRFKNLDIGINIYFIYYVLGFEVDTIRRVDDELKKFIVDDNKARETKRWRMMQNYLQSTKEVFRVKSVKPEQIYNELANCFKEEDIPDSINRNENIRNAIIQDLFKNIIVNPGTPAPIKRAKIAAKIRLLTSMLAKYIDFQNGFRTLDDRDRWGNKKIVDAGTHMENKFIQIYKEYISSIQNQVTNKKLTIVEAIKRNLNTVLFKESFSNSFTSGRWTNTRGSGADNTVIVDTIKRDNLLSYLTHIRRIIAPTNKKAKIIEKRMIHNTQWGVICPSSTSEGATCGLVKDPALLSYVSLDHGDKFILDIINANCSVNQTEQMRNSVYLNGIHIGFCDAEKLRDILVAARRRLAIMFDTGIFVDKYKELWVYSNSGRLCRPLMVVDKDTQELVLDIKKLRKATFWTLLKEGVIEYIDIAEQEKEYIFIAETIDNLRRKREIILNARNRYNELIKNKASAEEIEAARIALLKIESEPKYTHCEIDPTVILGISTALVPLPEFMPGPRVTYQCLWIFSEIKMGDGTTKYIKDINIGDEIITVNPNNLELTKSRVVNTYIGKTKKDIYKVKTESGAEIIATYDHLFLTEHGWIPVEQLKDQYVYRPPNYEKVVNIEKDKDKNVICDITIESENHSFIANGFAVHNSGMFKQALGPDSIFSTMRYDTTYKTLLMPGVPLFATNMHRILGLDEYPQGDMVIIAITTYGGQNQEDAIIFKKGAIERGLFHINITHSYKTTKSSMKDFREEFAIPEHSESKRHLYSKLDPITKIVRVGAEVKEKDCLVGKISIKEVKEKTGTKVEKISDESLYVELGHRGIVEDVYETTNSDSSKLIRIRIREYRIPQVGDKFASRYSQKGVIGEIIRDEDMPMVVDGPDYMLGVTPDVIFNPHSIPSRMTMGKIIEILAGLVSTSTGRRVNATAFRRFDYRTLLDELQKYGFSRSGKVKMIHGPTGRMMDADILVGPCYYQILKHLVQDKFRSRRTGSIQFLTRQPISGQKRGGGLKFGEMERDALIGYGASYLLQERMVISSDAYDVIVCQECGMWAVSSYFSAEIRCRKCQTSRFGRLTIPYAYKLFSDYLVGLNIKPTLQVTVSEDI